VHEKTIDMPGVKKETTRQRPESSSREGMIASLVGAGLGNFAIWAAMEGEYPSIIEENGRRKEVSGEKGLKYDKELRGKISRAINSTRALSIKDDNRVMGLVEACGGNEAQAKSLDQMTMLNRRRFSWGTAALDYIYGHTAYVHLTDSENSVYRTEHISYKKRDDDGVVHNLKKQQEVWVSGSWRLGDPMIPGVEGYISTRDDDGNLRSDLDLNMQLNEHGCPESFMSIWGGEPGVGKTKLAADTGKAINSVTEEAILYINGEDSEENFRMKCGTPPNPFLFKVVTANLMTVDRVCQLAYEIKPRVIFIDSVQTLAEWDKGPRGQKSCLIILRALMMDPRAGNPHIVLISQLNKKGDLKGARDLEHLADFVANVTKEESRKGVFLFECPRKNRGGETPRASLFKHLPQGVQSLSDYGGHRERSVYQLIEPTDNPIILQGVVDPAEVEEEEVASVD